jgi:hypothetical protein
MNLNLTVNVCLVIKGVQIVLVKAVTNVQNVGVLIGW